MKLFKKLILLSTGILLINFSAKAQFVPGAAGYEEISLLTSYTDITGSARMLGIGGAQMSLGGDIGSIYANPAGLGFYNRSEISFTPSFLMRDVQTQFGENNFDDFTTRFGIVNFGVVFNNTKDDISPGAWRGGSFGISMTKLADFNGRFEYEGGNNSSILDYFTNTLNALGVPDNQLDPNALHTIAYDAFLINTESFYQDGGANDFYLPIVFEDQFPFLIESVDTRGSHNQLTFGYGGNFADKFYIGANLGLGILHYESAKKYTEIFELFDDDPIEYPGVDFTLDETTLLKGTGINGSLGIIYRPNNIVRFGLSVTSPTFYSIRDERTADIVAFYSGFNDQGKIVNSYEIGNEVLDEEYINSDLIVSDYTIRTPAKYSGGMSLFFGKNGFITADIDYLNYANSMLSSRDLETGNVNNNIETAFQNAVNLRVGGEYRIDVFRLRAGYARNGDPYAANELSRIKTTYTAGAGLRLRSFFLDLAYQNSSFSNIYIPYDVELFGDPVNVKNKIAALTATVGFTF